MLADQGMLAEALEALLDESLDRDPILLIVDDLESILETPGESDIRTPVQADCRPPLAAILSAFGRAQTNSRLLITSRYRFTLPDGRGGDLADDLTAVALRPMDGIEQRKQLSAITRAAQLDALTEQQQRLAAHALRVAGGNPGLQATLITPILNGEPEAPEQALAAIEHYQRTGAPPEAIRALMAAGAAKDASNAILAFFRRMAFETYRKALSADQARMLSRGPRLFGRSADAPHGARGRRYRRWSRRARSGAGSAARARARRRLGPSRRHRACRGQSACPPTGRRARAGPVRRYRRRRITGPDTNLDR